MTQRRSSTLYALCATLLALHVGACDEEAHVTNAPPLVKAVSYCEDSGRHYIYLRVRDYERDPVDVELIRLLDGNDQVLLPTGSAGDGVTGLVSTRETPGALHRIEWARDPKDPKDYDPCHPLPTSVMSKVRDCFPLPEDPPPEITLVVWASDDNEPVKSSSLKLTAQAQCPQ